MSVKVGTDIIQISRVKKSLDKFGTKFLEKFLNQDEINIAKKTETVAGFWAAKEAISKALGCGIGKEITFHDITIKKDKKGAPFFTVNSENFNIKESSLSISHDGDFAIAVVVINLN